MTKHHEQEWTTIRVSRQFKEWLESKGVFGTDKSLFDILVRLLNWKVK